jgi:cyanophycinase
MKYNLLFFIFLLLNGLAASGQAKQAVPKGTLFIIGGGHRSPEFISTLIATAQLAKEDHIAVLPMSSEEPDTGFYYIKIQLEKACSNTIANLNFTKNNSSDSKWLDSLRHARLIFITGGDQVRFMNTVLHTPVYDAIHFAYENGATIAGTSAGAAVMSRQMITGNELLGDTSYHETFKKLQYNNLGIKEGLGLLDSAIIDQHFIVRSRYNRLLSALAAFPAYPCIGIDEATAIIVHGNNVSVAGDGQVIVLSKPKNIQVKNGLIKLSDLQFSIYTAGDKFTLK